MSIYYFPKSHSSEGHANFLFKSHSIEGRVNVLFEFARASVLKLEFSKQLLDSTQYITKTFFIFIFYNSIVTKRKREALNPGCYNAFGITTLFWTQTSLTYLDTRTNKHNLKPKKKKKSKCFSYHWNAWKSFDNIFARTEILGLTWLHKIFIQLWIFY